MNDTIQLKPVLPLLPSGPWYVANVPGMPQASVWAPREGGHILVADCRNNTATVQSQRAVARLVREAPDMLCLLLEIHQYAGLSGALHSEVASVLRRLEHVQ